MLNELKKYFGNNVILKKLDSKPNLALYLARRDMYKVRIEGVEFVLIHIGASEKFGAIALQKQLAVYTQNLQANVAFSFDAITRAQRDALLKHHIPFVALPGQIYLPFLGFVLSDNFKKIKQVNAVKMMPATQQLFLFLLYHNERSVLKSEAADALRLTRTSITRASEQLLAMELIEQEKSGKEIRMKLKDAPEKMMDLARPFMINPIQERLCVKKSSILNEWLSAGETALSECSMLNAPKIPTVAVFKGAVNRADIIEVDARWEDDDSVVFLELWKYDPRRFAHTDRVDPISLACSLSACEDERVEMAIDEMLEELRW